MGIVESALVGAAGLIFLVVVWTMREGRSVLSFIVGASAGLVGVQFWRVHLFTIVVMVWLAYRGGSLDSKKLLKASVLLLSAGLLAATALVGDLVNSPTLALQLLALAVSSCAVVLVSTHQDRRQMLYGLMGMTTLSSTVGILQVMKILPTDMWHLSISAVGRPLGLYPEPDWLGMFAGIGLVLAWRLDLSKWLRVAAVSVNAASFVLAFARAAWIAVAVSVIVAFVLQYLLTRKEKRITKSGRTTAVILLAAVAMTTFFAVPQLRTDLSARLGNTLQVADDDISAQARVRQINALLVLAERGPFYGHGISASGKVTVWGEIDLGQSENNVASNWILAMWVDGRFLAVPLITLFILLTARCVRTVPGQALLVVLLSSMFSNATYFPITWLLVALCLVEARQRHKDSAAVVKVPHERTPEPAVRLRRHHGQQIAIR
jgi:hypothetical protein